MNRAIDLNPRPCEVYKITRSQRLKGFKVEFMRFIPHSGIAREAS